MSMRDYPTPRGDWEMDIVCNTKCCATCEYFTGNRSRYCGVRATDDQLQDIYGYVRINVQEYSTCDETTHLVYGNLGACNCYKVWSKLYRDR